MLKLLLKVGELNKVNPGYYRPTWAEISFDALQHNIRQFRKFIPQQTKLMAVLKANAYGHGAVSMAREALACGADYLSVAFLDEALYLRKAGIEAPLLVLGYTPPEALAIAQQHKITLTIYSDDVLAALSQLAPTKDKLKVHIKIDTGMRRIGLDHDRAAIQYIKQVMQYPYVEVEGLYTHYASADEPNLTYTRMQYERFQRVISYFRDHHIHFRCNHAGNSATAIEYPELSGDMVRLGISMYGLYPSLTVNRQRIQLKPVMSFKTKIVWVKTVPPHSGISYGHDYVTTSNERIATLPVGYGDGYTRMLSGKANVLVKGKRVPVVGKICMDQCMINVSDIADTAIGEEVVLFGDQGGAELHVDELAQALGTINYELVCRIAERVPRVYMKNGICVEMNNAL